MVTLDRRRSHLLALAAVLFAGERPAAAVFASWSVLQDMATLAVLALTGALAYFGVVLALFGTQWLPALRRVAGRNTKDQESGPR